MKAKRGKGGRFVKRKARSRGRAKENPVRKRAKARRSHVQKVSRRLGRSRKTGKYVKRKRHPVRGYTRRKKARSRKKVRVARHYSYERPASKRRSKRRRRASASSAEEKVMKRRRSKRRSHRRAREAAAENPVRRKRRRSKRRARAAEATENPRKRRRAKRRRSSRRKSHARRAAPRRRRPARRRSSRRRSYARASENPRKRRRSRKRKSPCVVRKGYCRKRKSSHRRRRHTRKSPAGSSAMWTQHGEYPYGMENPLSNPLSKGEAALAVGLGAIGFVGADILDRYLAAKELGAGGSLVATSQAGMSPALAALTKPGIVRVLSQVVLAAVPFGATYYVHNPMGRAALQGFGLGAAVHLAAQGLVHWLILPLTKNTTDTPKTAFADMTVMGKLNAVYTAEAIADNSQVKVMTGTDGLLPGIGNGGGTMTSSGTISGFAISRGHDALAAHRIPRAMGAAARNGQVAGAAGASGKVGDCGGGCGAGGGKDAGGCGDHGGDCLPPDLSQGPGQPDPGQPGGGGDGTGGGNTVVVVSPPAGGAATAAAAQAAMAATGAGTTAGIGVNGVEGGRQVRFSPGMQRPFSTYPE